YTLSMSNYTCLRLVHIYNKQAISHKLPITQKVVNTFKPMDTIALHLITMFYFSNIMHLCIFHEIYIYVLVFYRSISMRRTCHNDYDPLLTYSIWFSNEFLDNLLHGHKFTVEKEQYICCEIGRRFSFIFGNHVNKKVIGFIFCAELGLMVGIKIFQNSLNLLIKECWSKNPS
ncbi:hypothetical protein ACJX0J_027247, partial [Zea mays]